MKIRQSLAIAYIQTKFKVLTLFSKRKAAEHAFRLFCTPLIKTKKKIIPKNAECLHFQLQLPLKELTIMGYRWNCPQNKKILILHGFGSAAYKFEQYAELLTHKGYEILAFDAPAHGKSDGTTVNALEYAAMIREVIKRYGPIQGFLAHSFGGIALSLVMETLEHDEQTKIVFIAPATETVSAMDSAFTLLKLNNVTVKKEFQKIVLALSGKPVEWFSIRRAIHNIKATVLWVHDEEDTVTLWSDASKVKEDNHSNVQFILTKGLGHQKIYHDAMVKKAIIDFL